MVFGKPDPKDPPHIVALRSLDRIRGEKLWQKGNQKQYYTEITDTLRVYIEQRFGIKTIERTSNEILVSCSGRLTWSSSPNIRLLRRRMRTRCPWRCGSSTTPSCRNWRRTVKQQKEAGKMNDFFFQYPSLLYLELLLIPMAALYVWRQLRKKRPYVVMSTTAPLSRKSAGAAGVLRHLPFVLRMIAVALLIVAIARPKTSSNVTRTDSEGIDIVLALDVSTSMPERAIRSVL